MSFQSEYRHAVGMEKLEWCGYPTVKKKLKIKVEYNVYAF